jgi:hypothetical protein
VTEEYVLPSVLPLPLVLGAPGPEMDAQVDELVRRDPTAAVALAMAIFRRLPTAELTAEVERHLGRTPGFVNARGESAERPPERLTVGVRSEEIPTTATENARCRCCDNLAAYRCHVSPRHNRRPLSCVADTTLCQLSRVADTTPCHVADTTPPLS